MNLDELTLGENRVFLPRIIEEIQEVAIRLSQNDQYMTRRHLVKELDSKISGLHLTDGLIVNSLVKETYLQTPSPVLQKAIAESFRNNLTDRPVYDPESISDVSLSLTCSGEVMVNLNKFSQISDILDRKMVALGDTDSVAEITDMKTAIESLVPENNFSLTGKTKVNDNLNYGKKVLEGYGNLVAYYHWAKEQNQQLIEDFKFLRNELGRFRNDVTELLFDIIGEDKKEAHPELFDFSKVEYVETGRILRDIDLAYNTLHNSFEVFQEAYKLGMSNIKRAGEKHADKALKRYSKTMKRKGYASKADVKGQVATAAIGFAFDAALEIMETRKNAEETVAAIKRDVEKMKLGLKEDAQKIAVDLLRLQKVYNRLKVILIPEARKFIIQANGIYNATIKDTYSQLVQGGNIAELSKENRKLVVEEKRIHLEIEDKKEGQQVCAEEITAYRELIAEIQEEYDYVNSIKPDPPKDIHNKLSFGLATGMYKKHLAKWETITQPVRSTYFSYVESIKLEEETIEKYNQLIFEMQNRLETIKELRKANKANIQAQGIKIGNFEPQLESLEKNIRKISEASRNLMSRGIQEDLVKVQAQGILNGSSLSEGTTGIPATTMPRVSNESVSYLFDKHEKMQVKIELLKFTEMAFTGEIISNFVGEKKQQIIAEQYAKVRTHLTNKISRHSKLDDIQAARLVDLGSEIFLSILRTQEIKAETNFLAELNKRLDQEFIVEFERAMDDLKIRFEKDRQEAETVGSSLNEATTADDLLQASRIIKN
ncbi:hypothetical protein OQ279_06940 [Salinimicrobium sp. MT39]|uniref:Uncharacterized protein n=1 Tax=Salinimicrobium profundisediminis TaxID=2994553 RepID=A0A9X3CVX8_9FLAO|nr:hypothetical protein [Salinimicrobium profundisediminis]MCX2837887.1 hypothetical protein [Salinimicrobium profundisediminis]